MTTRCIRSKECNPFYRFSLPVFIGLFLFFGCQKKSPPSSNSMKNIASRVDIQLRPVFEEMPPVDTTLNAISKNRQELEAYLANVPRSSRAQDRVVSASSVRVRIYQPSILKKNSSALLWFHGGGWTLGKPEMDEAFLQKLADEASILVVSVDYRLAPEHPFPAAHNDARAVLSWIRDNTLDLNVDPNRIHIGGSSSGANIAAGLALYERDNKKEFPKIASMLLYYPVLDDRLNTLSMAEINDPRTITKSFIKSRWEAYIGTGKSPSPYASPARAKHLKRMPITTLLVAELDPLRDEAVSFASRLWSDGVGCDLHVFRGGIHGFDVIAPESDLSKLALKITIEAIRQDSKDTFKE